MGGANNGGVVFKITPSGTFTTVYSFCSQGGIDCTDGTPQAGLVQARNGNLYGTTLSGGTNFGGTIFKITLGGTLTTVYSFGSQNSDGLGPAAGLIQATDGNFYGTTDGGGANDDGTVFKITPGGTLATLHSFDYTDGFAPEAALVQGTDGNFYGTTYGNFYGTDNGGTAFRITPSGTLTTLHRFCSQSGCTDGEFLNAGLVQDTNGKFFGTTVLGGANGDGTVFSLAVGLGPFVETNPTSGMVGKSVKILGTNLTGATSVTFNGTAATFTVASRTLITTTVPAGATSGKVEVTIPSGTLSSNVPFRVIP